MPLPPEVMRIKLELLTAVQAQPLGMDKFTLPNPVSEVKDLLTAESEAGLEAVLARVAELLLRSGSGIAELTAAVLLIRLPLATKQLTLATKVMVTDFPASSESKVIVRLLPVPPHTPPPVASQEKKVVEPGRLSVTTTGTAVFGPLLVTVIT